MKQNGNKKREAKEEKRLSPSRTRIERWKMRIVELYLQGNTMEIVVAKMKEETGHGFSVATVGKYVNEAITQWKKNKEELISNHKAIELEKINRVEVAAWYGWHRSLTVISTVKTKKKPVKHGENGKPAAGTVESPSEDGKKRRRSRKKDGATVESPFNTVEVMDESKGSAGDARFFNTIQWCIEYRCKLLGIEAPVKIETNTTLTANVNTTTTLVRKVVFKTRETTGAPQTLPNPQNN